MTEEAEKLTQNLSGMMSEIKSLRMIVDKHIQTANTHYELDAEWKTAANPVLQMGRDFRSFGKISKGILYIVITIGGAIGVLYAGIRYLKS